MPERGIARTKRKFPANDLHASASEILGVAEDASPARIRRAYLELVRVWHPDRFPDDSDLQREADIVTKRINEAYRTLCQHRAAPRGAVRRPQRGGPHGASARANWNALTPSSSWPLPTWLKQTLVILIVFSMSVVASAILVYAFILWD